ncbi:MAG: hypothetical protein WCF68_21780 [Terriglobales bacterium]
MSIAPVESYPPAPSEPATNANARLGRAETGPESVVATETTDPVSGTLPKQKDTVAKNVSSTYVLPQDVVELHQDPEIKDQIIIQYLDQAKDVILQVPSNQELNVERAIAQEFQQVAKLHANATTAAATAAAGSEGEKNHGD